jgi:putative transcriptional regulator
MSPLQKPETSGIEELLAAYVSGRLSAPLNALFAAHLELSPANRPYVRALETAAGAALVDGPLAPITGRDAKLAAIFALDAAPKRARVAVPEAPDLFPRALRRFVGMGLSDISWKRTLPGVKEYRVSEGEHGDVSLFWIGAGKKLPTHTHEGSEITLVLQGGFTDVLGHYAVGDVASGDHGITPPPRSDDDGEDCICFAVTDAPLVLTGAFGRWVEPFRKH